MSKSNNKKTVYDKKKILIAATALVGVILIIMTIVIVSGKNKDKDKNATTTEVAINVEPISTITDAEDLQVVSREGYVISELSGQWIDESLEYQRPLCIMINNISDAMPQSGIQTADIVYEMEVEGGITRLMCVFKDYANLPKLGPVRSARQFYVEVADMYDALYTHIGTSIYAEAEIPRLGVDNLDGMYALSGFMFYRDESRYAPHNCYVDGPRTVEGIEYMGYATEYTAKPEKMFDFYYEDTNIGNGNVANKISTDFDYNSPWFEYNADEGLYYRFQYGGPQIDDQTGEQLKFKNVIVMFVSYSTISDYGHQDIDWDKGGTGFYATNGEYKSITWKKDNGVLKYFDEDGNQLCMNPGQTFISVFDETYPEGVTFE